MELRTNKVGHYIGKLKTKFPAIHLQGYWLLNLGFEIGDFYTVEERKGELIIRKTDKQHEQQG